MFGTNPLRKADKGDGSSLWVQEIFGTIQGEGPFAGCPAIFVRLAGCNLKCYFCDTDFETSQEHPSIEKILNDISDARFTVDTRLVVLTGGEPLRQNIVPFLKACLAKGYQVQIETSGTLWPEEMDSWEIMEALKDERITIVCSPKTGSLAKGIVRCCNHYKYIVGTTGIGSDGLPNESTQVIGLKAKLFRPDPKSHSTIWLQPRMDYYSPGIENQISTLANTKHAADLCMRFGYRLSLQQHKILHLP